MPYGGAALSDLEYGRSAPSINMEFTPPPPPAAMRWWQDPFHPGIPGYWTTTDPGTGEAPLFVGTESEAAAAKRPPPVVNPLDLPGAAFLWVNNQKLPLDFFDKLSPQQIKDVGAEASRNVASAAQGVAAAANKVTNPFTKQRVSAPMTNQMGGGGVNPFHAYGEQW